MNSLDELCIISSGLVFKRKEAPPNTRGFEYKLVTLKSIKETGEVDASFLDDFVSVEEISEKHIAKKGDVIIRLSTPFTAAIIDDEVEGAIITSLFAVLRLKSTLVQPEFLTVCLNSESIKKQYSKDASGSALKMIKTSAIKNYRINIPSEEIQKKIVQVNRLATNEITLLEKLIEQKKTFKKLIIDKLMED